MKKLIATLFMMTLGLSLVAVAGPPTYNLKNGTYENGFSVLEPIQCDGNNIVYGLSSLKLDYTVSGSINRKLATAVDEQGNVTSWYGDQGKTDYYLGHVYFTSHNNFRMALFVDVDPNQTKNELFIDAKLNITDYGIYLFEDNDPTSDKLTYISLFNNDVEISEGMNFGVYYTADTTYGDRSDPKYNKKYDMSDEMGKTEQKGVTYTTAKNWVASYDGRKEGNHSNMDATWYSEGMNLNSDEAIFCMFQGPYVDGQAAYLEWEHVEFGFVTTGQPLPGTLATLLISGLCAAGLRKRNKK